jgi:hypothetical protein
MKYGELSGEVEIGTALAVGEGRNRGFFLGGTELTELSPCHSLSPCVCVTFKR